MPENNTAVGDPEARVETASPVRFSSPALTALVSVVLVVLFLDIPDQQPTALAFPDGGSSVSSMPVFELLTAAVWLAALGVIRRLQISDQSS